MKTYRLEIPSGETAVTAATWDSSCGIVPQDFTHTDDSGFTEIVTDGHWTFDNNMIKFTASTNPSNSVREGYMTITYTVDGVSCEKRTHLVQAAGAQPKVVLTLTDSSTASLACDGNPLLSTDITEMTNDFSRIREADIKSCVTEIGVLNGAGTFTNASNMTNVIIPDSVTMIGNNAFYGCDSLTSITLPNSLTYLGNDALRNCTSLTTLNIPDSVQTIGGLCFFGNTNLTTVVIGSGFSNVTDPGQCFNGCVNLQSVTVKATTPPNLGSYDLFHNTNNTFIIKVPSGSVNAYKNAAGWSDYASRIQAIS